MSNRTGWQYYVVEGEELKRVTQAYFCAWMNFMHSVSADLTCDRQVDDFRQMSAAHQAVCDALRIGKAARIADSPAKRAQPFIVVPLLGSSVLSIAEGLQPQAAGLRRLMTGDSPCAHQALTTS